MPRNGHLLILALALVLAPANLVLAQPSATPPPVEPDPDVKPAPDEDADAEESDREAPPVKVADDVEVSRNVPYLTVPGVNARALSLDIYAPKGGEKRPVVVYVHGGGWRAGDKSRVSRKPQLFCTEGWVFVSVNYRLLPAGKHPTNARDVAAALAWVKSHIAEYRGDPGCILLTGHSAGAHLAALVATDDRLLRRHNCEPSMLRAVAPLDTASYDLAWKVQNSGNNNAADARQNMLKAVGDEAAWRDASPMTHVTSGKSYPPFLLVYAGTRRDSPVASKLFADRLREVGVSATTFAAEGKNHGAVNNDLGKPGDPETEAVMAFFRQAIAGPDERTEPAGSGESGESGESAETPRPRLRDVLKSLDLSAGQAYMVAQLMREFRGRYDTADFRRQLEALLTAEQAKAVKDALGE